MNQGVSSLGAERAESRHAGRMGHDGRTVTDGSLAARLSVKGAILRCGFRMLLQFSIPILIHILFLCPFLVLLVLPYALSFILLPPRVALRLAIMGVILTGAALLQAPLPQWRDTLGILDMFRFGARWGLVLNVALLLIALWRGGGGGGPRLAESSVVAKIEACLDRVICVLLGVEGGLLLTLLVALAFRGMPGALALHLGLAGAAALVMALLVWRGSELWQSSLAIGLAVFCVLATEGGLSWPQMILSKAKQIAESDAYCLRVIDRPAEPGDMMLLTMPQGAPGAPGLILTLHNGEHLRNYRWSYRGNGFAPYGSTLHGACPTTALR